MLRVATFWVLVVVAPVLASNEEQLLANVIDSAGNRIPSQTVAPKYPRIARRDRVEGQVQVCFDVDREGRPRRIAVRRSTHRTFEKPSIKAVRASKFRPLGDEQPLQIMKNCRTFIFSLEPVEDDVRASGATRDSLG